MMENKYIPQILSFRICILSLLLSFVALSGCKKLLEVESPINEVAGDEIYNSNTTAASVITGIYTDMSNGDVFTGGNSISLRTGLSADELISAAQPSNIYSLLYTNSLTNNGGQLFWTALYNNVFKINSAIEGITKSKGVTPPVKRQLIAEAKFLRGFMYFYLVNLYGDVPLLLSTDIKINSIAARESIQKVEDQILADLVEARNELSDDYLAGDSKSTSSERLRPNKTVATALLARFYLYKENWPLAEQEASKIIENSTTYHLESLGNTFLANSKEAIWQLQPVRAGENTLDAASFVLASGKFITVPGPNGSSRPVYLSKYIFNAFELGDNRKNIWVDSVKVNGTTYPYAFKYKAWQQNESRSEYLVVFRLAEQYLIRAEARAHQGNITGTNSAASDLNQIRLRAGLGNIQVTGETEMLEAILNERKLELFTEWGHRWLDLKRTNKINQVMNIVAPSKNATWLPYKALYPIPVQDIIRNPSLQGHQNPGYPEI